MDRIYRRGVRVPPTEDAAQAARHAFDVLSSGARAVGRGFTDPDDDWIPVWVVITPTQGTIITTPGSTANVPEAKGALTQYVGDYARRVGAIAIGALASTWVVEASTKTAADLKRANEIQALVQSQDGSTEGIAERVERLLIVTYTAGAEVMSWAPITRHAGEPPTLGEFRTWAEGGEVSGRMVGPLQDALIKRG